MNVSDIVSFCIILMCGSTIKKTIEEEYPKVYKQYLEDRSKWKWYKKMWYLK